jgi:hypothetical protein
MARWWWCELNGDASDVLVFQFGVVGVSVLVTDLLLGFVADLIFRFVCFWRMVRSCGGDGGIRIWRRRGLISVMIVGTVVRRWW